MKKRTDFEGETRHPSRKGERLRVIEIRHVPTPDANERLYRAIDILLRSATGDTAEGQESSPPTARKRGRHTIGRLEGER